MKTPLDWFENWEDQIPDRVFLRQPVEGNWHEFSWKKAGDEFRKMANAISSLHLDPGSRIGIFSKNCAHWMLADLAIWMSGHVSVPIFPTYKAETVKYILENAEIKLLFIGKIDHWDHFKDFIPKDIRLLSFPYWEHEGCFSWEEFVMGKDSQAVVYQKPTEMDVATIIYSSGTSGVPKGVVHSFRSISFVGLNGAKILNFNRQTELLSYLPLCHVVERTVVELCGLCAGVKISFVESLDTFSKNLKEVKPTLFLAVPRIWNKFQSGILEKLSQKKLDKLLSIPVVSFLVKRKIRKTLGLLRAKIILTGGAPISLGLLEWFKRLGIIIREGYGLTENMGYSHFGIQKKIKMGTVGQAVTGVEAKISEQGEILVKSNANMVGYYKDPNKTKETLVDGWLHTGDRGEIDSDGYLKITGRIKEAFKTTKGKYIVPTPIEMRFAKNPHIENICVLGQGLPSPIALAVLSPEAKNLPRDNLVMEFGELLDQVNSQSESYEKIPHMIVLPDEWSIENSMITPTLKLKRNKIEEKYGPRFPLWFGQVEKIHFEP